MSKKENMMFFTGERYIPNLITGQIAYEHLHRYAFACKYVTGKTVLDIACGEGYGSNLLAKHAKKVIGMDISGEAVTNASRKYAGETNLEFRQGSCVNISFESGYFDVVVSFETIEHLAEHDKMLDEIKRVLKKDGILIISSPNRKTYTDDPGHKNEYHVKELYLHEFSDPLVSRFEHVDILGQRLTFSSHLWPLKKTGNVEIIHYFGDDLKVDASTTAPYEAMYFIAICTNSIHQDGMAGIDSLFTHKTDVLYADYIRNKVESITEKDLQIQSLLNSYSWRITAPLRKLAGLLKK